MAIAATAKEKRLVNLAICDNGRYLHDPNFENGKGLFVWPQIVAVDDQEKAQELATAISAMPELPKYDSCMRIPGFGVPYETEVFNVRTGRHEKVKGTNCASLGCWHKRTWGSIGGCEYVVRWHRERE